MRILNYTYKTVAALCVAFATIACNAPIKVDIRGQLRDNAASTIYLVVEDESVDTLASARVDSDNTFRIQYNMKQPTTAFLCDDNGTALAMFLTESTPLNMRATDTGGYVVEGGPMNDKYNLTLHQLSGLATQIMHIDQTSETAEEEYESLMAKYHEALSSAITYNLDNIIGVELFINQEAYGMTAEDMRVRFAQFSKQMQSLKPMLRFSKYIDAIERCQVGKPFVDVDFETITGETMPLSSICGNGQWVLLNFWATWSEPCLREIPLLKELYEKYTLMGFEICSISLDPDVERLRRFVADNQLLWCNALNQSTTSGSAVAEYYGVHSLPANFLISPDGEIVARDLFGEYLLHELQHKVAEMEQCSYPQLHDNHDVEPMEEK